MGQHARAARADVARAAGKAARALGIWGGRRSHWAARLAHTHMHTLDPARGRARLPKLPELPELPRLPSDRILPRVTISDLPVGLCSVDFLHPGPTRAREDRAWAHSRVRRSCVRP